MEKTFTINGKPVHGRGTKRLFKNSLLEFFSRTSPGITLATYIPIILLLLYAGRLTTTHASWVNVLIYTGGIFSWTFTEYIIHRFLFHLQKGVGGKVAYMLHGIHHEYPKDQSRLFMPPFPGILILSALFGIFYLIMGANACIFLAGLLNGYLLYSFLHYMIHTQPAPRRFKKLWLYHINHHYRDTDTAYGITSKFWDVVFRTLPDDAKKKNGN